MSNKTKKRFGAIWVHGRVDTKLDGQFYYLVRHDSLTLGHLVDLGGLERKTTIHGDEACGSADSAALAKVQVELEIERLGALILERYKVHEKACAADAERVRLVNSLWPDEVTS